MPTNKTFTMIKPDAVKDGHSGSIIKMIEAAGFRIVALKKTQLTSERAGEFYAVHKERPFYNDLCQYMSSGAIIPMITRKGECGGRFPYAHWCYQPGKCRGRYYPQIVCDFDGKECNPRIGFRRKRGYRREFLLLACRSVLRRLAY